MLCNIVTNIAASTESDSNKTKSAEGKIKYDKSKSFYNNRKSTRFNDFSSAEIRNTYSKAKTCASVCSNSDIYCSS